MSRYRRYSSDDDESIDIHIRRGRSPAPPPATTSSAVAQRVPLFLGEEARRGDWNLPVGIRDQGHVRHREVNRRRHGDSPDKPGRRVEVDDPSREARAERNRPRIEPEPLQAPLSQHIITRPSAYGILTLNRPEPREYRPIDLRPTHNESGGVKDVPNDLFNPYRGTDLNLEMVLPVHIDHSHEVETLSRLRRQGNFGEARAFFVKELKHDSPHPYIFVQYAQLLFDMGDYGSLMSLDARPTFGHGFDVQPPSVELRQWPTEYHASRVVYQPSLIAHPAPEKNDDMTPPDLHGLGSGEVRLLRLNWKLLRSLAKFHSTGTIDEALTDAKEALHLLIVHDEIGSTEIQVMCLALQALGHVRQGLPDIFKLEVEKPCINWADWPRLYQSILHDDQIWDFRDIFTATITCFGLDRALRMFFPEDPKSYRVKLLDNWAPAEEEESTLLAQLDMLVTMMLHGPVPNWHLTVARSLINRVSEKHPQSMGSRPVMKWMLADALRSTVPNSDNNGPITDMFAYLDYCPGIVLDRNSLVTLPIYVPFEFEIPGWVVPEPAKQATEVVSITLAQATRFQDYATQVLCLQLLILLTPQDPSHLFTQLGHLQKTVLGDTDGYLRTLMSSYLTCRRRNSEVKLLADLRELDNWTELNLLRDADLHLAKQQTERVLAAKVAGDRRMFVTAPSRMSSVFYPWLSKKALDFVQKLRDADFGKRWGRNKTVAVAEPHISPSPPPIIRDVSPRRATEHDLDHLTSFRHRHHATDSSSNGSKSGDDFHKPVLIEIPRSLPRGKKVKLTFESDEDHPPQGRHELKHRRKTKVHVVGDEKSTHRPNKGEKAVVPRDRAGPPRRVSTRPPAAVHTENEASEDDEARIYTASPRALSPERVEDTQLALIPVRSRPDEYLYNDKTIRVYPW